MRSSRRPILSAVLTLVLAASSAVLYLSATPAHAQSWGTISNQHSGLCLDDTGGSTTQGTQLQQWRCNGTPNQAWATIGITNINGTAAYQFQVEKSHMCLDLQGGSSAKGAHIIQWPCNINDHAQLWALVITDLTSSKNLYLYENAAADTSCMTVSADSQSSGALIQGWDCTSATNGDHSYYWTNGAPFVG